MANTNVSVAALQLPQERGGATLQTHTDFSIVNPLDKAFLHTSEAGPLTLFSQSILWNLCGGDLCCAVICKYVQQRCL